MKIFLFVGMYCFSTHLGQGQEHEATPLVASAETSIQQKSHHVLQSPRLCSATFRPVHEWHKHNHLHLWAIHVNSTVCLYGRHKLWDPNHWLRMLNLGMLMILFPSCCSYWCLGCSFKFILLPCILLPFWMLFRICLWCYQFWLFRKPL